MARINLGLVYGGRSAEREVSNLSARAVYEHLDSSRYNVFPIPVSDQGIWRVLPSGLGLPVLGREDEILSVGAPETSANTARFPIPVHSEQCEREGKTLLQDLDVAFPLIHGTYGEDGSLQGFLELCGLPYVGAGVSGSALGMDKSLMKDVLLAHGVPIVPACTIRRAEWEQNSEELKDSIERDVGYPCFVKPVRTGSSVGISKAHNPVEFDTAARLACRYDSVFVVEKGIDAREIECGVIGNDSPEVSVVGEVIPKAEFYDYQAKYLSEETRIVIPADVDAKTAERARDIARRSYMVLRCAGFARVDLFLDRGNGELFLNEINTIPGFTSHSMFPMLWGATGLPFQELLNRLVDYALERYRDEQRNEITVPESGLLD